MHLLNGLKIPQTPKGVEHPELLTDVIRSSWSIPWGEIGNVSRLTKLLPHAFPAIGPTATSASWLQSYVSNREKLNVEILESLEPMRKGAV